MAREMERTYVRFVPESAPPQLEVVPERSALGRLCAMTLAFHLTATTAESGLASESC